KLLPSGAVDVELGHEGAEEVLQVGKARRGRRDHRRILRAGRVFGRDQAGVIARAGHGQITVMTTSDGSRCAAWLKAIGTSTRAGAFGYSATPSEAISYERPSGSP